MHSLAETASENIITDYKTLYATFLRIDRESRKVIEYPWELMCLSGEEKAIEFAVTRYNLIHFNHQLNYDPLHLVALSGNISAIKKIVTLGFDPTSLASNSDANLLHITSQAGSLPAAQLALSYGIDIHSVDQNKKNALHYASLAGNINLIRRLIELGLNPNKIDVHENNALHYAISSGNILAVKEILSYGLDLHFINGNRQNILHLAAEAGKTDTMQFAIDKGINSQQNAAHQFNALHYAVISNNVSAIKKALECGVNLLSLTAAKKNVLMLAIESGSLASTQYLIHLISNSNDEAIKIFFNESLFPLYLFVVGINSTELGLQETNTLYDALQNKSLSVSLINYIIRIQRKRLKIPPKEVLNQRSIYQ
jgi:ankyrin repeat protein